MSKRLEQRKNNDIVAGDVVNGQLVLRRYGGSTVKYGEEVSTDPQITSLNPPAISAAAGPTTINVNGNNFNDTATIEINHLPVSTTFVSSTLLTTSFDPTVGGPVEFTVRQGEEESNSEWMDVI